MGYWTRRHGRRRGTYVDDVRIFEIVQLDRLVELRLRHGLGHTAVCPPDGQGHHVGAVMLLRIDERLDFLRGEHAVRTR